MPSTPIDLWVIVTCKGRLDFLKRTAPPLLEQGVNYCLVDYDCPQQSGTWLRELAAATAPKCQVTCVNYAPAPRFHKTHAQNLGACEAIRLGATHLLFSDADTLHAPGSIAATIELLAPQNFVIAGRDDQDGSIRSLTGFIALSAADFEAAGGYDEGFSGWGAEDIEFRLRLHLVQKLAFRELSHLHLSPLPHPDELRTEFQNEKSLRLSEFQNKALLARKLKQWTNMRFRQLELPALRLLFGPIPQKDAMHPNSPPTHATALDET